MGKLWFLTFRWQNKNNSTFHVPGTTLKTFKALPH